MKKWLLLAFTLLVCISFSCGKKVDHLFFEANGKLKVLSTTAMIDNLVGIIGGDEIDQCISPRIVARCLCGVMCVMLDGSLCRRRKTRAVNVSTLPDHVHQRLLEVFSSVRNTPRMNLCQHMR